MSIDFNGTDARARKALYEIIFEYGKALLSVYSELIEPYIEAERQGFSTFESSEKLERECGRWKSLEFGLVCHMSSLQHNIETFTVTEERVIHHFDTIAQDGRWLVEALRQRAIEKPKGNERDENWAQINAINSALRELGDGTPLKRARQERFEAFEATQRKLEEIRTKNPFGLPEGINEFHFDSIMEIAQENGYTGKEQNLIKLLNKHEHGAAPNWTPKDELIFDRASLTAFLEKRVPKWRKKVKEK